MRFGETWDIFCNVIDNFGDIGVCWRLARQLVAEHGLEVRLWVDDLASLQKLCPEISSKLQIQSARGVEVRHWTTPFPEAKPADVVIEAFGCNPPESYIATMAASDPKPVWINLEYLSAEDWVPGCHGLASPHPRLPLVKYFFFPGFVPGTGGLLLERGLLTQRQLFQQDFDAIARFWTSLELPAPAPEEIRVSLFGYENKAVSGLFNAWVQSEKNVLCLVPEGRMLSDVSAYFGQQKAWAGSVQRKGHLEVRVIPFVEQDQYDRLLWACDCNFVRGEDSFVRAQWAARPFVWHIYPQEEGAHFKKLSAFMDVYCEGLPQEAAVSFRTFWEAWNRGVGAGEAWAGFWKHRAIFETHASHSANHLAENGDLASNLVHFCKSKI